MHRRARAHTHTHTHTYTWTFTYTRAHARTRTRADAHTLGGGFCRRRRGLRGGGASVVGDTVTARPGPFPGSFSRSGRM